MFRKIFIVSLLLILASCAGSNIFPDIGNNEAAPINIWVNSAANRAYLINSNNTVLYKTGSIQVLDITTPTAPTLIQTATLDNFSGHTYLDVASNYLFVSNRLSSGDTDLNDNILRVNVDEASANFLQVDYFADGSNPFGLTLDASATNLYIASYEGSLGYFPIASPSSMQAITFAELDMDDGYKLVQPAFRDVAIIGTQAYLSVTSGGILVVNLTGQNAEYFINDVYNPRAITTDGTYIYITGVDTSTSPSVNYLYKLDPSVLTPITGNTTVSSISKSTAGLLVNSVAVGNNPQEILVLTNYIFVSNTDSNTVSAVNRATFVDDKDITVGTEPFGLAAYRPGGVDAYLYVTNLRSSNVSIVDLATLAVVATY